jgi:hypothetical protein
VDPPGAVLAPAYAATVTPDPDGGGETVVNVGALTGNVTIGAVANPMPGQRLFFLFTQDGTGGRTVTWNAAYKHSWSDTGNTAGLRASITMVYDGTGWVQVGAQRAWA